MVGLGNPGQRYAHTRHNIGFRVLDRLADSWGIPLDRRLDGAGYGTGSVRGNHLVLARPLLYMNRSGPPVRALADAYEMNREEIVVIHDDLDLPHGKIKFKKKGGHGGHNGLRSLIESLGGGDFARLRVGIGRPPEGTDPADYVLSEYEAREHEALGDLFVLVEEAVLTLVTQGIEAAMNLYNNKSVSV